MTRADLQRWQLFDRLNKLLAETDPQSYPHPQILEWIAQMTGASGVEMIYTEQERMTRWSWGQAPQTIEASREWELLLPLSHTGDNNRLRLIGRGQAIGESGRLCAQAIASTLENSLATNHKILQEHESRQIAESLVEISRSLSSTRELEEVLAILLDRLAGVVPYDSANVMLMEDGRLHMHAARGYKHFTGPADMSQILLIPNRLILMQEALEGTQPIILPDTLEAPDWMWIPGGEHIRSWMGVPLRVKDQVIGIFSIDKAVPNFFTPRHAHMASALATHAALALDNALMFAQIREAQSQLCGLSAQIIATQEQERQKIAVELHDHAGQALLGLRAELQILKHHLPPNSDDSLEQIKYLDEIVLEISQDLRQLAHDLRPPMLSELGLLPSLEQYIEDFSRRMKIPATFEFQHERELERLPENIELICYRIVQEALTNLIKHAKASKVRISLEVASERLRLAVVDDGVGFSPHQKRDVEGFGLIGIRERVTAVGGQLQVFSQPGRGTQLVVQIPLDSVYVQRN